MAGGFNLWRELQAGPELASFLLGVSSLIAAAPVGDGHPVMVMPGLGGGDSSTRPLRQTIDRLGYVAHGWGQGINSGLGRDTMRALRERLAQLFADDHRRL